MYIKIIINNKNEINNDDIEFYTNYIEYIQNDKDFDNVLTILINNCKMHIIYIIIIIL